MRLQIDRALVGSAGIGFDEVDRQIPTCGPDYGKEIEEDETPLTLAADLLSQLFARIIPASGRIRLDLVGQKFLALHFMLNRSGTTTLTEFADRAEISKQLLGHFVTQLSTELNFQGSG